MAEYTQGNLSQPGAVPFPSVAEPAPAPNFTILNQAIEDDLRDRKQAKADAKEASIFQKVTEEQTNLFNETFGDQEQLTSAEQQDLAVFNEGDDYERQEALKNPNVKAALAKFERIRQGRTQARSPEQLERYYVAAANITKQLSNDFPQYAEVVQDAAQKALGFDPIEKAIGIEQAASVRQREFEEQKTQALITKAVDAGVVDIGPDGSFDQQSALRKGQALAQQEYIIDQQTKQQALLTAQRVPEEELARQKFSGYMRSVEPMIQNDIAAWGANMLQLYPTLANDPASQTKLQEAWSIKRASFLAQQEQYIASIDDPNVQQDVRNALNARLSAYDQLYTGDFSTLAVKTRQLDILNKQARIDLHKAAPIAARLDLLSSPVGEAVINSYAQSNPEFYRQIVDETINFATTGTSQTSPESEITTFTQFAEGVVPLSGMTDVQARGTIRLASRALDKLSESPNNLEQRDLDVYSNMALQLSAVAATRDIPNSQVASASRMLSSPSKMRLFERYANDPNADPRRVEALAQGIEAVNLKNINAQAALLRDYKVEEFIEPRSGLRRPAFNATPVYDANAGRFTFETSGTGTIPKNLQKQLDDLNQSLDAIAIVRSYGNGRAASLSEEQTRQYIADTSGFRTVGERVEVPLVSATQGSAAAPRSTEDMINALIEAGRAGDRAAIEAIIRGGQGTTNPRQPLSGDLNAKIDAVASQTGLDAELLRAVVRQESGGNPNARSSVGAIGLTQLMPATAKELGVDPHNPDENLLGGARYLRQQWDKFGDVRKALAAYNWGPSRVEKAVEKYGDEWDQHLPAETENYIKSILGV